MSCIFCKIIAKELSASVVYEDQRCISFLDINPINVGHLLVIPKVHQSRLCDLSEDDVGYMFQIGKRILKAMQDSDIRCEGANLLLSDGPVAGQEVMHSHLHIIPRFAGDGQNIGFRRAGVPEYSKEKFDAIGLQVSKCILTNKDK